MYGLSATITSSSAKELQYNTHMTTTRYREFTRYNELQDKIKMLEDLYETAEAEDDRWTMNKCWQELEEINKEVDELESEH